jgi:hypothetical protein
MAVYFKQRWEEGRAEIDYDFFTLDEMPLYGIEYADAVRRARVLTKEETT